MHRLAWTIVAFSVVVAIIITFHRKINKVVDRYPRVSNAVIILLLIGVLACIWLWPPEWLLTLILSNYSGRSLDRLLNWVTGSLTVTFAVWGVFAAVPEANKGLRHAIRILGVVLWVLVIFVGQRTYIAAGEQEKNNKQLTDRIDILARKATLLFYVLPTHLPDKTGRVINTIRSLQRSYGYRYCTVSLYVKIGKDIDFSKDNFDWKNNSDPTNRNIIYTLPRSIQPGTHTPIINVSVTVPPHLYPYQVYFSYSCQQCEPSSTRNWVAVQFPPYWNVTP